MRLPKLFRRNVITGVMQYGPIKGRPPMLIVFTPKKIVEIDFKTGKTKRSLATLKEIKEAK